MTSTKGQDNRSLKLKSVDGTINLLFKSNYLKDQLRWLAERILMKYRGYKFSYISSENGELELIEFLGNRYSKEPFLFFDVGAHHGTYTEMVRERCSNCVGHLFEPTPESYAILKKNYSSDARFTLVNAALSNFDGEAQFMRYPDDPTRNGLSGVGKEPSFKVDDIVTQVTQGDSYCAEQRVEKIHLLKIDAEGHDFNVIRGFAQLLKNKAIDVIQFEYTFKHADMRVPLRDYYEFFQNLGYRFGPLRMDGVEFYEDFDPHYNQYEFGPNYIAVKEGDTASFRRFERREP